MAVIEDFIVLSVFVSIQLIIIFLVFWLLRKRQVWPLIRLGISGHGSLAQKILPDNGIEFVYSGKPITKLFWKYRDSKNRMQKYFQPIEGVKHTLAGTSIPIHLCPFNASTNISVLEETDKELTAKETNELMGYSYLQGVTDTRKMLQKPMGFGIDPKLLIIAGVLILVLVIAWPTIQGMAGGA